MKYFLAINTVEKKLFVMRVAMRWHIEKTYSVAPMLQHIAVVRVMEFSSYSIYQDIHSFNLIYLLLHPFGWIYHVADVVALYDGSLDTFT